MRVIRVLVGLAVLWCLVWGGMAWMLRSGITGWFDARAAEGGAVRGAEVLDLQPGRDPREAGVSPREAGVLDDHIGRRRAPDHERAAVRDGHALDRLAVMHDERRPRAGRLARALHRVLRQGRVVVLAGQTVILVGRGRPRQRVP